MQIIIDYKENKVEVAVKHNTEGSPKDLCLADVLTGILTAFKGIFKNHMDKFPPESEEDVADTYDCLVYLFNNVLDDIFPEIKPLAFELSDAAVLYAQDQIIDEAYQKGITFDEAIAEYEKKAQEYINARKMS